MPSSKQTDLPFYTNILCHRYWELTWATPSSHPLMTCPTPKVNLKGLPRSLEESNFLPSVSVPRKTGSKLPREQHNPSSSDNWSLSLKNNHALACNTTRPDYQVPREWETLSWISSRPPRLFPSCAVTEIRFSAYSWCYHLCLSVCVSRCMCISVYPYCSVPVS